MSELMTASENAMVKIPLKPDKNVIPKITDPMGKYWSQPNLSDILIDDTHVVIEKNVFMELSEYSCSIPSGCYPGKAWRRLNGAYDEKWKAKGGVPYWQLCWFGYSSDGDIKFCSNQRRDVIFL